MPRKSKAFHGLFHEFSKAQIKFWHVKQFRLNTFVKQGFDRMIAFTTHVTTWQPAGFEASSCGHSYFVYFDPCNRCVVCTLNHSPSLRKGNRQSPTSRLHRCFTHTCRKTRHNSKPTISKLGRVLYLAVSPNDCQHVCKAQHDCRDRGTRILDHRPQYHPALEAASVHSMRPTVS